MLKVGLTGGIGCGKSTACRHFQELGITVIDADVIARHLVEPGQALLPRLAARFGPDILATDGSLDRPRLKSRIFTDPELKRQLEDMLHPLIYQRIATETMHLQAPYCIVAVPLLLETGQRRSVDRVLVIDCDPDTQLRRVMQRDGMDRELAMRIIASQMSRQERLRQADDVVDNSTTAGLLAEQIKRLHNSYILLASVRTSSA